MAAAAGPLVGVVLLVPVKVAVLAAAAAIIMGAVLVPLGKEMLAG